MIWQNPWAFLGLVAVAVPVIIHLLGRRSARIRKFPTLRFVGASRLMATRWTRLSDLALLAVRMGIIAAAVLALARPLFITEGRNEERGRSLARAIIVDTSASMMRAAQGDSAGRRVVDRARAEAQRLAAESAPNVIVQTMAPASALRGAARWLERQPGRRELVVVSDFQRGTIDSADIAPLSRTIGLALVRAGVSAADAPIELVSMQGRTTILAHATVDSVSTGVDWSIGQISTARADSALIFVGDRERGDADAAMVAARSLGTSPAVPGRPIAVMYDSYAGRDAIVNGARLPSAPWQADVIARLRTDTLLAAVAVAAPLEQQALVEAAPDSATHIVVARTSSGTAVVSATTAVVDGIDRVVVRPIAAPGSLLSAAAVSAALRATSRDVPPGELEPAVVADTALAHWERDAPASDTSLNPSDNASDGRWLWVLALLLMGLETWMRRVRRDMAVAATNQRRAA